MHWNDLTVYSDIKNRVFTLELADIPKLVLVAGVASVQKAEKEEKCACSQLK